MIDFFSDNWTTETSHLDENLLEIIVENKKDFKSGNPNFILQKISISRYWKMVHTSTDTQNTS